MTPGMLAATVGVWSTATVATIYGGHCAYSVLPEGRSPLAIRAWRAGVRLVRDFLAALEGRDPNIWSDQ